MKYSLWVLLFLMGAPLVARAEAPTDIAFPVLGEVSYANTFLDSRSRGRIHHAADIMAKKMQKIVAAVDGKIEFAPMVEPSYGYMIIQRGSDGIIYNYVHLNNDTPGTDDGNGGVENAYAPGIKKGVYVKRGDFLGYVGDSGNAESTGAHLHFEIYDGKTPVNPYPLLKKSQEVLSSASVSASAVVAVPAVSPVKACVPTTLVRTAADPAVYFCGRDGGKYLFPSESIFLSWNKNFDEVQIISADVLDALPLNGTIRARGL